MSLPEEPPATPPGEDLRVEPLPYEQPAEYIARVRSVGVVSTSPSDIVPNVPWTNMGPPEEIVLEEEEVIEEPPPPEEDPLSAVLAAPAPERKSATELVEEAEAAQSSEELDAIEAQAEGRVTVIDAVEKRRSEL